MIRTIIELFERLRKYLQIDSHSSGGTCGGAKSIGTRNSHCPPFVRRLSALCESLMIEWLMRECFKMKVCSISGDSEMHLKV